MCQNNQSGENKNIHGVVIVEENAKDTKIQNFIIFFIVLT
jgi:hypothetical protein